MLYLNEVLGTHRVYYSAFKASPVGRWASRSAIRIIFPISLLLRGSFTLNPRRLKIHHKSWIFGWKRFVSAALHSNSSLHLTPHVSAAVFTLWGERRCLQQHWGTTFPQRERRIIPLPLPLQLQVTSLTPPSLTGATWRKQKEEQDEQTICDHWTSPLFEVKVITNTCLNCIFLRWLIISIWNTRLTWYYTLELKSQIRLKRAIAEPWQRV